VAGTVTGVEKSSDHPLLIQVDDAVLHPVYRPNNGLLERLYEHMVHGEQPIEDWLPTVRSFLGPRLPRSRP
jgi:hypothetical protein